MSRTESTPDHIVPPWTKHAEMLGDSKMVLFL
ncbi:unnamed protein product [Anisakis simplex]|uniref:Peroxiredoxin n=1 Tax=Anisakis simplex TaxID=6269 RepID=A0A0M3JQH3_ANISI|nr:unnamed protein product [Anisakis simplex]